MNYATAYASPPTDTLDQRPSSQNDLTQPVNQQLNAKLQEAMTLYYNRQYRLALPLLQEVADQENRTQVLFWLGRAAYESNQTDLAIEKYEQILAREPNLSRVRLELAAAYVQAGNKSAAQAELQKILDANPNAQLKQQIEQSMTELDQPARGETKRWFSALRATIGTAYDSNINSGSSNRDILAQLGISNATPLDGWLMKFNVNGDVLYDFGQPNGFAWHNRLQFLHHEYPDPANNNYNYTQTDVSTGLDYYGTWFKAKLPVGFIDRRFRNTSLSQAYYFMPNVEVNVANNTDVTLSYRYEDEDFTEFNDLSNRTHTVSFGPRYQFQAFDADHYLSLLGAYSRRTANMNMWSYNEWSVGPSYFARFKTGTELYLDFKFFNRDYDAPAGILVRNTNANRRDDRCALSFALSQTFYKYYFASLNYTYTDNISNNNVFFSYDKHMIGVNIGTNLNF